MTRARLAGIATLGVAVAAYLAILLGGAGSARFRGAFDDGAQVLTSAAAALACARTAVRRGAVQRQGWLLLAGYAALWCVGILVWSYYDLLAGGVPASPAAFDIAFLGGFPMVVVAVLVLAGAPSDWSSRARVALDGLIITGSLLLIVWVALVGALRGGPGTHTGVQVATLLMYPCEDMTALAVVVLSAVWVPRDARLTLAFLGGATFVIAISDSVFAYQTAMGTYSSGSVSDVGYIAGFGLIALEALGTPTSGEQAAAPRRTTMLGLFIPSLPFLCACPVAVFHVIRTGSLDRDLFFLACVVVLLIVARQLVALADNLVLTQSLQRRVDERTAELEASREELRLREQEFRLLFLRNPQPMFVVDAQTLRILEVNDAAVRQYGHLREDFLRMSVADVAASEDATALHDMIRSDPSHVDVHTRHRLRNGQIIDAEVSWRSQRFLGRDARLMLAVDVTARRRAQEELAHQAMHDALTGLPNRTLFLDHLSLAIARRSRRGTLVGVLFLDLDDFKPVNDTLGHAAGDRLLTVVADRLRSVLREEDTAARLGGDEFAVICEDLVDWEDSVAIAERILEVLHGPVPLEGTQVGTGVSIGIALADRDGRTPESLLRDADVALYRAKELGKGRYAIFDETLRLRVLDRGASRRTLAQGAAERQG